MPRETCRLPSPRAGRAGSGSTPWYRCGVPRPTGAWRLRAPGKDRAKGDSQRTGEVGHAVVEKAPDVKCEGAHREQKNHDEDIGQGCCEVGRELALEDRQDVFHAPFALARAESGVVMERKTSSSRPASE